MTNPNSTPPEKPVKAKDFAVFLSNLQTLGSGTQVSQEAPPPRCNRA